MRVAFTSCMRIEAFQSQPVWNAISDLDPEMLILLGDQIYMDYWPYKLKPKNFSEDHFRALMDLKYSMQWKEPHFKKIFNRLLESDSVFAVWDDHDFAWNNAVGSKVSENIKAISRELFHKWIPTSTNKPEIYHYVDKGLARFIFLDQRSYAEQVGNENDLLGDQQYEFLKGALNHSQQYTVISGGMTLTKHATIFGIPLLSNKTQHWKNYQKDYQRFSELISKQDRCLYLGGDIHGNAFGSPKVGVRPCYEVVSSGVAIDKVAGFGFYDKRHNWGVLDLNEDEIKITLTSHRNLLRSTRIKTISSKTWEARTNKKCSIGLSRY